MTTFHDRVTTLATKFPKPTAIRFTFERFEEEFTPEEVCLNDASAMAVRDKMDDGENPWGWCWVRVTGTCPSGMGRTYMAQDERDYLSFRDEAEFLASSEYAEMQEEIREKIEWSWKYEMKNYDEA